MHQQQADLDSEARKIVAAFEQRTGLRGLDYKLRPQSSGGTLVVFMGTPTERFYGILNGVLSELEEDHPLRESTTLKKVTRRPWLLGPEARLLQVELASILTVDRFSFNKDLGARYIPSVFGAEAQIESEANHIVFGRRGSGKSSLLVYAMRRLEDEKQPFAWIDMQAYEGVAGHSASASIILDVMRQVLGDSYPGVPEQVLAELRECSNADEVPASRVRKLVPAVRTALGRLSTQLGRVTIFLDDIHLLATDFQPEVLATLYSIARGNRTHLKISGIEGFTKLWDARTRKGVEIPDDAQAIRLDYNLTNPSQSLSHITDILTAHAIYCGLPSITVICSKKALSRLVWLAAGVPRDAINVFSQAMTVAASKEQKSLTVTSLNTAASAAAEDKMRFVAKDSSGTHQSALEVLERVKDFCIKKKKKNAFLVEIANDHPTYESIRTLVDLRLLHVLNPGITPDQAGKRYVALLLDYGFYTGLRAARSVDLFQKDASTPTAKTLRKLPRFTLE